MITYNLLLISLVTASIFLIYTLSKYVKKTNRKNNLTKRKRYKTCDLKRHTGNPIMSPDPKRDWDAHGSFNPTAVRDTTGLVHLFYRAIGRDGISRIGHATTKDCKSITHRSPYPVYTATPGYGMPEKTLANAPHKHDHTAHPSGGGWGGSEDPRATKIDDRVYITYTSFESWENMRIGLTSISVADLEKGHWNWKNPQLISPPKIKNKNWVLFPEKINGKYALLHSVAPKVLVAYVDNLDAVPVIESSGDHGGYGYHDNKREKYWDKTMKGAGPAPLRTDSGWLVLYHAIDQADPGKYKVGAMLLDIHDPTKMLHRSPEPILAPDMLYENDGKPGIVYATGALIEGDQLIVFYGGGDKHTCVAHTPLKEFLAWLTNHGSLPNFIK